MQETQEQTKPAWLKPRGMVDEIEFCRQFYMHNYLTYENGAFYSPDGRISDENILRRCIYLKLRKWINSGAANRVESILNTLRLECPPLDMEYEKEQTCIFPANGTYHLCENQFIPRRELCRFRLPVAYNEEAPRPERWLKFVTELLYEEDIPTLQEYMGYCLLPTTKAQKMLIITGRGGEGKSRLAVVMKALLGDNMTLNSIAKVEHNPFARADLEHTLLMVDDDLNMDAMRQTNYLKSIITAELPMDLERKGVQSYQGQLCVRFLAFGNDTLQSLHDRSHGFFRRQIILTAKERDPNRQDDPNLGELLADEAEGILLWCMEGLRRLWIQNFRFTMSNRAKRNLLESMARGNNAEEFMKSQGYITFDPDSSIPTRTLYRIYREWCEDNALLPLSSNSFASFLNQNCTRYQIRFSTTVPFGNGKRGRGYVGLRSSSRL